MAAILPKNKDGIQEDTRETRAVESYAALLMRRIYSVQSVSD